MAPRFSAVDKSFLIPEKAFGVPVEPWFVATARLGLIAIAVDTTLLVFKKWLVVVVVVEWEVVHFRSFGLNFGEGFG
jgi:hypothetical protein